MAETYVFRTSRGDPKKTTLTTSAAALPAGTDVEVRLKGGLTPNDAAILLKAVEEALALSGELVR